MNKLVEFDGVSFHPDAMHTRLLSVIDQLTRQDVQRIPDVNAALVPMGITVAELDGTGWLWAETPLGRVGSYATIHALLIGIILRYQQRYDDYKRRFERLLDVFTWNEERKMWTIHPYYQAWVNEATEGLEKTTTPTRGDEEMCHGY